MVDILLLGEGGELLAEGLARLEGIRDVIVADDPVLSGARAEAVCATIRPISAEYTHFVMSVSTTGKDVMPRLAAMLDIAQVSDVTKILGADTFEHPIYAGNALETVRALDPGIVLTVRSSSFEPARDGSAIAPIRRVAAPIEGRWAEILGQSSAVGERPDLTSASVVISGGRAFGSKESFDALLGPLADRLHGAVGASRAAVDAGYAGNDLQVGQTGKIVAPEIYIAVGISGAIQHLAGMKDAKLIVAINKDPGAPIFEIADYALVGDLFTVIPELTALLDA